MKEVLKKLNIVYYSIYVSAVLVALIGFQLFRAGLTINPQSTEGIAIVSILILYIIGSIPITLAVFNKKVKKWALMEDVQTKLNLYKKASVVRLCIIGSGFLLGILFFFLMNSQSMIFCAGISAIALFFCKPAEVKIVSELQITDN
ncbi:hypothetical protein MASR2M117_13430 [Paludibacter sp.]